MADTPTRKDVAKAMRDMDLCFMSTHGGDGTISSRPMSNNAQVDWDGDNWFFSHGDTRKVRELEADPAVTLDFQSRDSWITLLQGEAELHRDKALFADHWTKDLDRWFQAGIDTSGLTLIQVRARLAEVNGRMGEGRVDLTRHWNSGAAVPIVCPSAARKKDRHGRPSRSLCHPILPLLPHGPRPAGQEGGRV